MENAVLPRFLATYHVDGVVGRGGMGIVYRARDPLLDRAVALKVLTPAFAEDPDFRGRFLAESRLAASLEHPNVVPIYQAGEHEGVLFLAMRLVEGDDLRSLVRRDGPLRPLAAAAVVAQVAAALDAAHGSGLVHRDVKPANVLVAAGGHAYLTDFGLSRHVRDDGHTGPGDIVGTLDFIAPEQVRGTPAGVPADVYALGATAFYVLTGRAPFPVTTDEGKLWAHLNEPPPAPSVLVPSLPRALDDVLGRAMAKDPAERFGAAGAFAAALAAASEHGGGPAARSAPARRAAPSAARPPPRGGAAAPAAAGRPRATRRPGALAAALVEPFNLAVLLGMLAAGVLLNTPALLVPLAVAVYAIAVARSVLDLRRRAGGGPHHGRTTP